MGPAEPEGVEILLGEYREIGKNHGKPVFRRKRKNEEQPDIYIYFWDKRDGPDFTGWWFGENVGTSHVWSRCALPGAPWPPAEGWRIPWDGAVKADLRIRRAKSEVKEELAITERQSKDELPLEEQEEKLLVATDQVAFAEAESTEVLDSAVAMLEGEVTQDAAEAVVELVQTQLEVLMQAHRFVAAEIIMARKEAPKVLGRLQKLTPRVRAVQAGLAQVLKEAKANLAPQQAAKKPRVG
eukprot:s176_g41.t1